MASPRSLSDPCPALHWTVCDGKLYHSPWPRPLNTVGHRKIRGPLTDRAPVASESHAWNEVWLVGDMAQLNPRLIFAELPRSEAPLKSAVSDGGTASASVIDSILRSSHFVGGSVKYLCLP